jgi:NADP-dependent 3-hydroxy acid dehydrogenase YdfG
VATVVAGRIEAELGRCDILINSTGLNIRRRSWVEVDATGFASVLEADLTGPFHTTAAVLPMMRARGGTGSSSKSPLGPVYTAAKHGLVVLSDSINLEECAKGIRSCCICPANVATSILDARPVPVRVEERARMLHVEDLATTILFVAGMPARVCINEILVSPTWNRFYIGAQTP